MHKRRTISKEDDANLAVIEIGSNPPIPQSANTVIITNSSSFCAVRKGRGAIARIQVAISRYLAVEGVGRCGVTRVAEVRGSHSIQSARLPIQSSELGSPTPSP
jgi:hypothetical protein